MHKCSKRWYCCNKLSHNTSATVITDLKERLCRSKYWMVLRILSSVSRNLANHEVGKEIFIGTFLDWRHLWETAVAAGRLKKKSPSFSTAGTSEKLNDNHPNFITDIRCQYSVKISLLYIHFWRRNHDFSSFQTKKSGFIAIFITFIILQYLCHA